MLPLLALVIIILGSFFNCCNVMCSFFIKTDLFAFCFVRLKLLCHHLGQSRWGKCLVIRPQPRQGYLYWHIFKALANSWADTNAFHFPLTVTDGDTDIFA